MNIDKKMDELIKLLDSDENIKRIKELKTKIGDEEIKLINNYRDNPTVQNKLKLYDNKVIDEYLKCETKLNYLIMEINSKFKRSNACESNKW